MWKTTETFYSLYSRLFRVEWTPVNCFQNSSTPFMSMCHRLYLMHWQSLHHHPRQRSRWVHRTTAKSLFFLIIQRQYPGPIVIKLDAAAVSAAPSTDSCLSCTSQLISCVKLCPGACDACYKSKIKCMLVPDGPRQRGWISTRPAGEFV